MVGDTVRVVTDSAADLADDIVRKLGITIVPLVITTGGRSFADGALSRTEFWRLSASENPPGTSQPSRGAFERVFSSLIEQGHRVLCITVTGRHSGTFSSAWSVARQFDDLVTVVDSSSLSLGMGWQVMRAARMALENAPLCAILDSLRSLQERTRIVIQLDTLRNIRHGGRAARLMPALERLTHALDLKALINVVDGELRLLGVSRSYKKGVARIRNEIERLGTLEFLAVGHTLRENVAQALADQLAELTNIGRHQIIVFEAGSVLACHGGEGLIAAAGVIAE